MVVGEQECVGEEVNRNKRGWILTSGLAVLVLAGVGYLQTGDLGRNDMLTSGVYIIDVTTLFRDYRENESVAAARLTDKQVQVSGVVVSLERDDRNNLVLSLNSGDAVLPVDMFMLPSEEATVSRLTQGDHVFVQCTEFSFYLEVLSGNGCVLNAGAEQQLPNTRGRAGAERHPANASR